MKLLYKLFAFFKYPKSIQRVIYTTNLIERTIKEIRKHIKVIEVSNIFPFI